MDESVKEIPFAEYVTAEGKKPKEVFLIETKVSPRGGHIMKQLIEYRDRLFREKRWEVTLAK